MPYKAGPGQQMPLLAPPRRCPQHKVSIWPESQVTYHESSPRGSPPSRPLWPFQQIQGPWGGEGYLGKASGEGQAMGKDPQVA